MAQHTPGPWFEQNADLSGATHYIVAGDRETLLGIWTEGTGLGSQAKANRQLMIASPELLAALKVLLAWNDEDRGTRFLEDGLAAARAAIAKAEG